MISYSAWQAATALEVAALVALCFSDCGCAGARELRECRSLVGRCMSLARQCNEVMDVCGAERSSREQEKDLNAAVTESLQAEVGRLQRECVTH